MSRPAYRAWMNIALYQAIWFIAVLGKEPLSFALLLPLGLHLGLCREQRLELAVMACGAAIGLAMDTVLTFAGVFQFDPAPSWLPVPLWLVGIWLGFCATLRHSLTPLIKRPWLMVIGCALFAPLSYLGAARLGAVDLPLGPFMTASILAPCWALVGALLVLVTRRLGQRQPILETASAPLQPSDS